MLLDGTWVCDEHRCGSSCSITDVLKSSFNRWTSRVDCTTGRRRTTHDSIPARDTTVTEHAQRPDCSSEFAKNVRNTLGLCMNICSITILAGSCTLVLVHILLESSVRVSRVTSPKHELLRMCNGDRHDSKSKPSQERCSDTELCVDLRHDDVAKRQSAFICVIRDSAMGVVHCCFAR
jgi:hypothetical protein